jgi:hypothetical protein
MSEFPPGSSDDAEAVAASRNKAEMTRYVGRKHKSDDRKIEGLNVAAIRSNPDRSEPDQKHRPS